MNRHDCLCQVLGEHIADDGELLRGWNDKQIVDAARPEHALIAALAEVAPDLDVATRSDLPISHIQLLSRGSALPLMPETPYDDTHRRYPEHHTMSHIAADPLTHHLHCSRSATGERRV